MIQLTDDNLRDIKFDTLLEINLPCWIAGGCILDILDNQTPSDIDIFFPSKNHKERAKNFIIKQGGKCTLTRPNGYKILYNDIFYDFIFNGSTTPEETIEMFDYTVCGIAIDKSKKIYTLPQFEQHWKNKILYYTGNDTTPSKHSSNKAKRLLRYLQKGYWLTNSMLIKWLNQAIQDQIEKSQKR